MRDDHVLACNLSLHVYETWKFAICNHKGQKMKPSQAIFPVIDAHESELEVGTKKQIWIFAEIVWHLKMIHAQWSRPFREESSTIFQ